MKTAAINVRVAPATKAAIEKAAADDNRSVASLVEKVLIDWLRSQGKIKGGKR
jgi:hypothetical protein